jgi:Casein kinase II regulatory subunit
VDLLLQGNVDGAYFGTTFPHLLLMTYPSLRPARSTESYTPRIFGFKLHASALEGEAAAAEASGSQHGAGRGPGHSMPQAIPWHHLQTRMHAGCCSEPICPQ